MARDGRRTQHARMTDEARWTAVVARDARLDDAFVYAVRTTGVYCKPSCASRKPRRDRVDFFASPIDAKNAGFRACKRCFAAPSTLVEETCARIREAIADDRKWTMPQLAGDAGVSPTWLHRVFTRAMGVSPKTYADALRARSLRDRLERGESVTEATYASGYGSSRAVNETATEHLGMTPRAWKKGGEGESIRFGTTRLSDDALGVLLVACTDRGVCAVRLGGSARAVEEELRRELPRAEIVRDDAALGEALRAIAASVETGVDAKLPFDLRATSFQLRVWSALRSIPRGKTWTYRDLARSIGEPRSVRAVARACASNPAAVVVPCHRVVRGDGDLAGYRWGVGRKKRLLEREKGDHPQG